MSHSFLVRTRTRQSIFWTRGWIHRTKAPAGAKFHPFRGQPWTRSHTVGTASLGLAVAFSVRSMLWPPTDAHTVALCEAGASFESTQTVVSVPKLANPPSDSLYRKIKRVLRVLRRICELTFSLAPVALLFPFFYLVQERDESLKHQDAQELLLWAKEEEAEQINRVKQQGKGENVEKHSWKGRFRRWYFELCLRCVERSGAAIVKLMQWAGSRPDFFGQEFCNVFSRLQDHTTPHKWKHTAKLMKETYGDDWEKRIQLGDLLGSGCIGQVYRGTIYEKGSKKAKREVAVKVLHPAVEESIDADLDLLRFAANVKTALEGPSWLDWSGMVEEFSKMLKTQLDLRIEGRNLVRFAENFKEVEGLEFPAIVSEFPASKGVLVETFLDGQPVMQYARENRTNTKRLHDLCYLGIRAVCKMIFLDNFLHGDLHPGNVFISHDGSKFFVFDAGIATEYTDDDHRAIVGVLGSFIRRRGREAGERLVDRTYYESKVVDAEGFIQKMDDLATKATSEDKYLMQNLGVYISFICKAAADHHVHLIPAFVSAALAVKVQEGIALALDPSLPIIDVAIPIVVEAESRRKVKKFWGS